ncbi:MAG: peptidoglycan-associated lipoprotein [Burkholderiales bacterium]|jgi:peptidoglycan-associated lipoprotein
MHSIKLLAPAVLVALLSACSSTPLGNKAPVETRAATPAANGTADTRSVATVNAATDPLNDPKSPLAKRSIYFDYDSYILRNDAKPVADAHAKYLTTNKNRKIVIEGNTDERGGAEYNLALGQKRAEAVRKGLSLQGVSDSQMEAVSFGKEKPKATGSDEASWAENRRADIVYR